MSLKPTMMALKKAFAPALLLLGLALSACEGLRPPPPPTELSFADHPSVLRGDWSGTIPPSLLEDEIPVILSDLVASCDPESELCYVYTFVGNIALGDEEPLQIEGEGSSGYNNVYILTSPIPPTGFGGRFTRGDTEWNLSGTFTPYNAEDTGEPPAYEAQLYSRDSDTTYRLTLIPNNP